MLKFGLSLVAMILWIKLLNESFPGDAEGLLPYIFVGFLIFLGWVIAGIVFRLLKYKAPGAWVFAGLTLISCFLLYEAFPWYDGYTGVQIIRDYAKKKDSVKKIEYSWIYLPNGIENLPLIAMAQKKFSEEVNPEECYMLRCCRSSDVGYPEKTDRYMIYFKNRVPFTTNPTAAFEKTSDSGYHLSEWFEGKELFFVSVKDGVIYLASKEDSKLQTFEGRANSIELENGIYRCTLEKTDANDGFDVRYAYWVYKLF